MNEQPMTPPDAPTTTHAAWGAGNPRLVFNVGEDWDGSPAREFPLVDEVTTIGASESSTLRLVGLDPEQATIVHEEDDEYVLHLVGDVEPVPALSGAGQSYPERTQADYEAMVRAAQVHIGRGDVFQMVPSQLIARPTAASAFSLYRALRAVNPSPYMVFCDLGDRQIVSASPETHVSLSREGIATLKPIAGTRRRDADGAADDALARELEADEKERAEHLMLVDLARNDLGRVCAPGSVTVSKLLEVERYSHVMHLVSQVDGRLRDGEDAISLLEATFPAGTVSGAPKVRAMQLISQIEGTRRGVYAGALGYVGFDGSLDTCIALRTIVMRDGVALLQAGAGIVADSDPASEHVECMNKLAALSAAIDLAETGRYGR